MSHGTQLLHTLTDCRKTRGRSMKPVKGDGSDPGRKRQWPGPTRMARDSAEEKCLESGTF